MLKNSQSGFALIEVLVASTIIAIGLSGVGALMLSSLQATQDSSQVSQAMWISTDLAGRIQSNITGAYNHDYTTAGAIDCNTVVPSMCANHVNLGASTIPVACTATQMALFDTWNALCGTDVDSQDSAGEFLRDPSIESSCTEITAIGQCTQYTTELRWSSANDNSSINTYINIVQVEGR